MIKSTISGILLTGILLSGCVEQPSPPELKGFLLKKCG